jgi:hypothetical protein
MVEIKIKRQVVDLVIQYRTEGMLPEHIQWCITEYFKQLVNLGYFNRLPKAKVIVCQTGLISLDMAQFQDALVPNKYDIVVETDTWLVTLKLPKASILSGWVEYKGSEKSTFWFRRPDEAVTYVNPQDIDKALKTKVTKAVNKL